MLFGQALKGAKDAGMKESDLGCSGLDHRGLVTFKEYWSAAGTTRTTWRTPAVRLSHLLSISTLGRQKRSECLVPGYSADIGRTVSSHIENTTGSRSPFNLLIRQDNRVIV